MPTLDSQVHAYERNHPGRPWIGTLYGPPEVTGDQMVAAMDAVGVDGAILAQLPHPNRQFCPVWRPYWR
jgi:L-fuconolactonase